MGELQRFKFVLAGALAALLAVTALAAAARARAGNADIYPPHFLWGAATSAHQIEGVAGGGENSDWYEYEHRVPSPIDGGQNADVAADHWHRYPEDMKLASDIGLNSLRISIAWEKVEPAKHEFNKDVIQHYRDVLMTMRKNGIKPMVAFHHFTQPLWFAKEGAWLADSSPSDFLEYAKYVVTNLGDLCDLWITFNEPASYITQGYLGGGAPPEHKSLSETYTALYNVALAHRLTADMIHELQGLSPNAKGATGELRGVGLANSLAILDPADPKNKKDRRAARILGELSQWDFVRGLKTGLMKFDMPKELKGVPSYSRQLPATKTPPLDWIGVNYYTQWLIGYNAKNFPPLDWKQRTTPPLNDGGWPIYPEGLERILRQTSQFNLPLVVTENGIADSSDQKRPEFLREHLKYLDRALQGSDLGPALDVRGYYYWTLTDDFEWQSGNGKYRMGLVEIQYDNNLKRVVRPSAQIFKDEIRKRSASSATFENQN